MDNYQYRGPHCIILVGNIGLGKSTYINTIENIKDYLVFSDDALFMMFNNDNYYYSPRRDEVITKMLDAFTDECNKQQRSFIIDMPNMTEKSRWNIHKGLDDSYKVTVIDFGDDDTGDGVNRRCSSKENMRGVPEETWRSLSDYFKSYYDVPYNYEYGVDDVIRKY